MTLELPHAPEVRPPKHYPPVLVQDRALEASRNPLAHARRDLRADHWGHAAARLSPPPARGVRLKRHADKPATRRARGFRPELVRPIQPPLRQPRKRERDTSNIRHVALTLPTRSTSRSTCNRNARTLPRGSTGLLPSAFPAKRKLVEG